MESWVGVDAIARHLGVAKDTVYRWVESKGLPAHRAGRLLRFRISEVDDWMSRSGGSAVEPPSGNAEERDGPLPGSPEVRAKIDEMVRRIVERFDPERIVLFGSHARGDAGPDSDVDLLVVLPVSGSKHELEVSVRLVLHDIRIPKDIIVATRREVEKYRDVVGTIIHPALRDGRILYERVA